MSNRGAELAALAGLVLFAATLSEVILSPVAA
jgi:hypothetical protein